MYYDNRFGEPTPDSVGTGWTIWERQPAVAARDVLGWKTETFNNYPAFTAHLRALTTAVLAT